MPDKILDAHSSDPVAMGWMQGLPPAPDKRLAGARADHMRFPTHRYAYSRMREFLPTARVSRGLGPVWELPVNLRDDIDAITFKAMDDGRELTWAGSLAVHFTDAVLVLLRGSDDLKDSTIHVALAKHRTGRPNWHKLFFDGRTFTDQDPGATPAPKGSFQVPSRSTKPSKRRTAR